jgi:hypothetical protein
MMQRVNSTKPLPLTRIHVDSSTSITPRLFMAKLYLGEIAGATTKLPVIGPDQEVDTRGPPV